MNKPSAPKGYNTINPFVITKDAPKFIEFVKELFGATDSKEGFTLDTDGLVLHAELYIGDSTILVAERKPNWVFSPAFLQIYVDDIEVVHKKAEELGATIVTEPTPFYGGDTFSRIKDPFDNLWWVYQHDAGAAEVDWDAEDTAGDASWEPTKEMTYIHDTLIDAMDKLGK